MLSQDSRFAIVALPLGVLVAYIVIGFVTGVLGSDATGVSKAAVQWYITNLLLVTLLYMLLRHFVAERARLRTALEREHALLVAEQAKSERLLLNILPAPIAARSVSLIAGMKPLLRKKRNTRSLSSGRRSAGIVRHRVEQRERHRPLPERGSQHRTLP